MKHVNTQNLQHTLQGIKGIIHHGEISIDRDELPHGSTGISYFSMNEIRLGLKNQGQVPVLMVSSLCVTYLTVSLIAENGLQKNVKDFHLIKCDSFMIMYAILQCY